MITLIRILIDLIFVFKNSKYFVLTTKCICWTNYVLLCKQNKCIFFVQKFYWANTYLYRSKYNYSYTIKHCEIRIVIFLTAIFFLVNILNKNENATLQLSIFCEKVLDTKYFQKAHNVSQIRQTSINLSRLMSELCSFKFLKLYLLNFAIVHAQIEIVMLIKKWS